MKEIKNLKFTQPLIILIHVIEEISFGFPLWATKYFGTTTLTWYVISHMLLLPIILLPNSLNSNKKFFLHVSIQAAIFTNSIFHILTTILFKQYSPGVITSLFIVLPYSLIFFYKALTQTKYGTKQIFLPLFIGSIAGIIVVLSLFIVIPI